MSLIKNNFLELPQTPDTAALPNTPTLRIDEDGNKIWELPNGHRHREDGPAYEGVDGSKIWYINDQLHRTDGPAYERGDGTKQWYLNGKMHREDGPAHIGASGTKEWFIDDQHHREDGPAIERADGGKAWYIKGQLHRTDGPAVERADGTKEWYIEGKNLTEDEFKKLQDSQKQQAIAAEVANMVAGIKQALPIRNSGLKLRAPTKVTP